MLKQERKNGNSLMPKIISIADASKKKKNSLFATERREKIHNQNIMKNF